MVGVCGLPLATPVELSFGSLCRPERKNHVALIVRYWHLANYSVAPDRPTDSRGAARSNEDFVCFGPIADIGRKTFDVCFVTKADIPSHNAFTIASASP